MTEPLLRTIWTDPVSGRRGFLVIDRLINGIAGGGTRLRAGCSLAEVERLAHAMSLKNGALRNPAGGAKLGLDVDPQDPEAKGLLVRFVKAMAPFFESEVATGEDMGTSQELLLEVFAEAGLGTPVRALEGRWPDAATREAHAVSLTDRGIAMVDLIGGYGVAEAAIAAMVRLGLEPAACRASIQGFGSMGGSTARYLNDAGVRVVAVSDVRGVVANPEGLDVELLLATRKAFGEIDRSRLGPGDRELAAEDWLLQPAELLIPAAIADAIDEENCARITARLVVEAANIPTTAAAEARLLARGIPVIPDFVANSATNAWLWWLGLGLVEPTVDAAWERIARVMRQMVGEMFDVATDRGVSPRQAATQLALANLEAMAAEAGAPV